MYKRQVIDFTKCHIGVVFAGNVTLWEGYYKGPTYTEFPVTHFFYNKNINLDYTYGNSEGIGNVALMPCFEEELKKEMCIRDSVKALP